MGVLAVLAWLVRAAVHAAAARLWCRIDGHRPAVGAVCPRCDADIHR